MVLQKSLRFLTGLSALASLLTGYCAQAAQPPRVLVADDQSSFYQDGKMGVREGARLGAISVLDFSELPPKISHLENVPCSVVGPPANIAAFGDKIVVTQAMKPENGKLVSGSLITLLELKDGVLKVLDTQEAGGEPVGVRLSPDGKRAYVAVRKEGAVARYRIDGDALVLEGKQTLFRPEDALSLVAISPDGKTALASLHTVPAVVACDVLDDGSLAVRQTLSTPNNPYDIHFVHGNDTALVSCTLVDTIATLARGADGQWAVVSTAKAGRIAEGLEVSPDEKWVSVSCFAGANATPRDGKWFGLPGRVYMFALEKDGTLTEKQVLDVEGVQQAAAFSPCGNSLFVGRFGFGDLAVYKLEDGEWVDTGARYEIPGQAASIFTQQ